MSRRQAARVMREFWDAKAHENATYYISSYRAYDQQDEREYLRHGSKIAKDLRCRSRDLSFVA